MSAYRRNSRGAALFVALAVVVIVMAAVLTVNARVQRALSIAAMQTDATVLSQAAAGAVHAAIAVLVRDKQTSEADHLLEDWALSERIVPLAEDGLPDEIALTVQVTDLRSLVQVNALVVFPESREIDPDQQALWHRLLDLADFSDLREEDRTAVMIVNCLKDWLDRGDDDAVTGLSGAEAPYYAALPVPYACRNGPLQSPDELLLVNGITPALYRGNGTKPGLADVITIFGADEDRQASAGTYDGRVNINTAPLPVLAALLPEAHQDLAPVIVDFRREMAADDPRWTDPHWYREAPGCQDLDIDRALITTASDLFRIRARASIGEHAAGVAAVVRRGTSAENGQITYRILSWQPC